MRAVDDNDWKRAASGSKFAVPASRESRFPLLSMDFISVILRRLFYEHQFYRNQTR